MSPLGFDKLAESVHDCIKDTFGETQTVTYTPKSTGVAETIIGVFNTRHQVVDPDTEQVVDSNVPTLGIKRADISVDPVKGDLVVVRSLEYRVHSSQEDGEGWIELYLYEVA